MGVIKNYFYNLSYQILLIIIPLVTLPYLSRILGSEALGTYSFTFSILQYFLIFVYFGVNIYGAKAIAIVSSDNEETKKVFWSNFSLKLASGIIVTAFYLTFIFTSQEIFRTVFLIQIIFIASASIDIAWYFVGIQNFQSIFFRNLVIKISGVCLIFIFVRQPNHLWRYVLILSTTELMGQISLFAFLPQYLWKPKINFSRIRYDLVKTIPLFITQGVQFAYGSIDKTILGVLSTKTDLGYYDISQKIIRLTVTIVTSMGFVLLPKMSSLHSSSQDKAFKQEAEKSFIFALSLSMPIAAGIFAISPGFVPWFLGSGYNPVIVILRILAPSGILMALNNVIGFQILIALNKERRYLASMLAGTILNVALNILLAPRLGSFGISISFFFSELIILIIGLLGIKLKLDYDVILIEGFKCLMGSLLMCAFLMILGKYLPDQIWYTIIQIVIGIIIYFSFLKLVGSRFLSMVIKNL